MINEQRLLQLFIDLTAIDAPSLDERHLADHVVELLLDLGLSVHEDDAGSHIGGNCGNLYAQWPGTLPWEPLLFCVHLDTVEPSRGKKARLDPDGVIRSSGDTVLGADDLAGLAAILEAIRSLADSHAPHRPVSLLITVAEELHLAGSAWLEPQRLAARQAYVLDTDGPPGIVLTQAPGNIGLVFELHGQSAHAGMAPETGISAISAAARGIAAMRLGRIDQETTANIGSIHGGGQTNIVADRCVVTAECRSQRADKLQEQADHMCRCMQTAADALGAGLVINRRLAYEPYAVNPGSQALARFRQACSQLDMPCVQRPGGGGSDNNRLVQHGIDGLVLACGMTRVHSCQESIRLRDLSDTARLVEALIMLP